MGTEVLLPQDCLGDRFRVCPPAFCRRKSLFPNGNGFPGNTRANNGCFRRPMNRPERLDQKKKHNRETQQPPPPSSSSLEISFHHQRSSSAVELPNDVNNMPEYEFGRVMMMRRGQSCDSLDAKTKKETQNYYYNNNNNKAGISEKKLNMDCDEIVYAGSAFSLSPSPSSLPLPSFFNLNNNNNNNSNSRGCEYDDSATRDLRRLLRLE